MTGWAEFAAALILFLLSHAIPVRPPVRPWLVARLGLRGYFIAYSLLSLGLLWWLIVAAARAPYVEVIPPADWLRWVPILVMPFVCLLAVLGAGGVNPLSFGGMGKGRFDPDRPGVLAFTRHPLLLAMLLWALAHLLANGDLAHVILFGLFAAFSAFGMAAVDRRYRRELGEETWATLARNTARLSLRGFLQFRATPWQIARAALLYGLLIWLHPAIIGVSPLP